METERLILRRWKPSDLDGFAALNADPRVMEFFPMPLTRDETAAGIARMEAKFDTQGFCFWAMEDKSSGDFVGFTGLNRPAFPAPFMPCVEVGWRLAHRFWGRGLATEAARASIAYGFDVLRLNEIVAFTARDNARSRAVMHRLGMIHSPTDDFEHPNVADGSSLRSHVLYRLAVPGG